MIPENIIEEIKSRNDIADVISSYVTLKRAGSHSQGLCPFHNEKSPSFTVFSATQSFYCFGCQAAGDVVTFIRKIENLDYVESLHFLAKRAGVTIPDENENRSGVRRSRIYELNREAAKFFRSQLLSSDTAKSYLISRGISRATVNRFGLGYSGVRGYEAVDHLKRLGYSNEEMFAAKIIGRSERGDYPYFRNRVIFPIIDISGSVIGFGGRVMDNSKPKYLNSPDTIAFSKGSNLFAMNFAKSACEGNKKELILCEGYMDVIAMHAAGFTNSVATLGTALTNEQARLIKKYTNRVVMAYDSDGAGRNATDRGSKILAEAGIDVRILRMKGAKDPDEYIKTFGAEAFKQLIIGSETKFDYILTGVLSKYDVSTGEGKIKASAELCTEIAKFDSAVEREIYISKVSDVLGISKDSLASEMKKAFKRRNAADASSFQKRIQDQALGKGDKVNPEYISNPAAGAAEEAIIGILLLYPERVAQICSDDSPIKEDDFVTAFNRRVFTAIKRLYMNGIHDESALGGEFSADEMGRIFRMRIKREGLDSSSDEVFADNIAALKLSHSKGESDLEKMIAAKRGSN